MLPIRETGSGILMLLNALPGKYLIVLPDQPHFTILAASDDIAGFWGLPKKELTGKSLLTLTDDPRLSYSIDRTKLLQSLQHALLHKKEDRMEIQQEDILNPNTISFENKSWQAVNQPVMDEEGKVQYIIHRLEEKAASAQKKASALIEKEGHLLNTVLQAPVAMCILRGADHTVEVANAGMLELWDKTKKEVINKPLFVGIPEAKDQGLEFLVNRVFMTGETYRENERKVVLRRNNQLETVYVNLVYQALTEKDGKISGILAMAIDVTELVLSRKKIEENEEELRLAISVADLGTFHVDLFKNTATYSERVMDWFGLKNQDQDMEDIFSRIHEEDRSRVKNAIGSTLQHSDRSRHLLTYRVMHPDGSQLVLRSYGNTFFDKEGRPYSIIGIIQDITSDVKHQQELEENEAELQRRVKERTADLEEQTELSNSILDASTSGVAAMDAIRDEEGKIVDMKIVKINRQFLAILGLKEDVTGSTYLKVFPNSKHNGIFELYRQVLVTGHPLRKELFSTNLGLNAWFDVSVVKRGEEGIAVTFVNITSKREAALKLEQQKNLLDNILTHSPSGITVTEVIRGENNEVIDGRTIMANEMAEKFIGVPLKILLNSRVTEIDPNMLRSELFQKALDTLETGNAFITQYFFEPAGRWLELAVSRMDENRLINVFTDVTSVKETQIQLEMNLRELKRSNANLEEFAYAASHDMKEPIRKIHFFSDRLKEKLSDRMGDEDRRLFERMENAAKRMGALIDDLLVYSHVSRGIDLEERIDLNQKIQMVLQDLELEIEQKGATVRAGQLPVVVGHRRQMQQLFQNLISNALKYNRPGVPPQVDIRSKKIKGSQAPIQLGSEDADKDYYLIEVEDNGIGFEPKESERIFNVFTRLHGNTEYKGTGVGLSIVRKVVENHGGRIWAESKPGEGSLFRILLPAHPST